MSKSTKNNRQRTRAEKFATTLLITPKLRTESGEAAAYREQSFGEFVRMALRNEITRTRREMRELST